MVAATTDADVATIAAQRVAAADVAALAAMSNGASRSAADQALFDAAVAAVGEVEAALAAHESAAVGTAATPAGASSTDITSRLRIVIDANAESDAGVTFGAMVRIQQGEGQQGATNGARSYAKSGGLEVGVGNIWGALESMPGQYPIDLGLTGLGYDYGVGGADAYSSGGLVSSGANGIEVMYSMGDFTAHISASDTNDRIAAYGAYTFSGWTVALGLQDSSAATDTEITATVGGTVGPVSLGLAYAETGANVDRFVLSAGMDVGAATNVEAYYASQSNMADDSYGIDFNHSLGGGTSLRGGVASNFSGQTVADFGVRFNF
ncbi:porin [Lentibacter algarum]|uniref:porin n=1 Tax=Lentibacter algarum TaxID=576131 RepID=UPI002352AB2A|nr:porin [Lentibacter algarum]